MAKLLYIEGSPRKERSASIKIAKVFLEAYRESHPNDEIEKLDVWEVGLPRFDGETLNAKYAILHGLGHTEEQADAWRAVKELFNRFNAADKYLFSLPMWNFNIPYRMKHFIDVITQPTLSFSFSPEEGYRGLVTGRPALTVFARGGNYPEGTEWAAFDTQKPYFELWLRFIGFTDLKSIMVETTLADPETVAKVIADAETRAREIAETF